MQLHLNGRGGAGTVKAVAASMVVKPDDKPEWTGTYVRHVMDSRHVAGPEWPGAARLLLPAAVLVLTGLFGSVLLGVSLLLVISLYYYACDVRHVLLRGAAGAASFSVSISSHVGQNTWH